MGDHWDHLTFVSLVYLKSMVRIVHLLHVEFFLTDRPTDRQTFGIIEAPVPELKALKSDWNQDMVCIV